MAEHGRVGRLARHYVLARRIARVRKWNYHRLSHTALLTLALLRDLDVRETDATEEILRVIRTRESLRSRLRRKRRALVASLLGKAMGLHRTRTAPTAAAAEPPKPNLKEQIVEQGVVRGLASTLRGVTDGYIRQKLDEIDERLKEWRDREIANRLCGSSISPHCVNPGGDFVLRP